MQMKARHFWDSMTWTLLLVILCITTLVGKANTSGLIATPMEVYPKYTKTLTLNCSHPNPETTAILKIEIRKKIEKSPIENMVNQQGQHPSHQDQVASGAPFGTARQQLYNSGLSGYKSQVPRSVTQTYTGAYEKQQPQQQQQQQQQPQQQQPQQQQPQQQPQQQQQQPQQLPQQQQQSVYQNQPMYRSSNENKLVRGSEDVGAYLGFGNVDYGSSYNRMTNPWMANYYKTWRKRRSTGKSDTKYVIDLEDKDVGEKVDIRGRHVREVRIAGDQHGNVIGRAKRNDESATNGVFRSGSIKGRMDMKEMSSVRMRRSLAYANRRFPREQRSLDTATLGGGDVVQFVPMNGRFKGQGRMASPAYLTVEISAPEEGDSGQYICTITHMGSKGQLSDEYTVNVKATDTKSLEEIKNRVSQLEGQLPAMSLMGQQMQKLVEEDTKRSKEMQEDIEKLKKENQDLVAVVDELKEKFKVLSERTTTLMEAQAVAAAAAKSEAEAKRPPSDEPDVKTAQESTTNSSDKENTNTKGTNQAMPQQNGGMNGLPGNRNGGYPYQQGGYQNSYGGGFPSNQVGGQWGNNMPYPQYGNNGYYRGFPGTGAYGQQAVPPPPHPQQLQQQQPQKQQQQQMGNGQFGPGQQGMYGMGYPPAIPGPYGNMYGYGLPMNPPHLKSDDLTQITARMDDLENTRISALENDLKEVKVKWVQPMDLIIGEIQIYANVTLRAEVAKLQSLNLEGLIQRVDALETEIIPGLTHNLSMAQTDIQVMRGALDVLRGREKVPNEKVAKLLGQIGGDEKNKEEEQPVSDDEGKKEKKEEVEKEREGKMEKEKAEQEHLSSSSHILFGVPSKNTKRHAEEPPIMTTSTTHKQTTLESTPSSRPRCFVCGNNATQENCTPENQNKREICVGDGKIFCMTDVYEDGMHREIYKRCVTEEECRLASARNDVKCATSSFLVPEVMECHYCCSGNDCNSSIRPVTNG